jgi:hypothetical protein
MRKYNIEPRNTYNMDKKGFFVGITTRSKHVFSKAVWQAKLRTAAIQDGNREWITLLACVCGDGEAPPPALIYDGKAGLQSSWVEDVKVGKHQVFLTNSPSGWTNSDVGLTWLEQLFERFTAAKARRQWRLLIVDGHGSHLTCEFIDFCNARKILLAVFPPHSTHTLSRLMWCYSCRFQTTTHKNSIAIYTNRKRLLALRKATFFQYFGQRGALQ